MFNQSKITPPGAAGPPGTDADAALVQRCRQGDLEAFGTLVARHDRRVSALVARILGPGGTAEDVDDAVQDVFIQAWRALPGFRADAKFSTWLYRIAANRAVKQWHRTKRQAQTIREEELPLTVRDALTSLMPGPADTAALRARDKDLRTAIDHLPEKQRTAILLHYFEDYSCEEVAQMLGCSVGTVWSRLHYACRKLRESVAWLEE